MKFLKKTIFKNDLGLLIYVCYCVFPISLSASTRKKSKILGINLFLTFSLSAPYPRLFFSNVVVPTWCFYTETRPWVSYIVVNLRIPPFVFAIPDGYAFYYFPRWNILLSLHQQLSFSSPHSQNKVLIRVWSVPKRTLRSHLRVK